MKKLKDYQFTLNSNPTSQEVDEALSVVYEFIETEVKFYESKCPLGYEELGFYVFNRVLNMLTRDGGGDWRKGMVQWLGEVSWKTVPQYLKGMMRSGFIDYTRSFYSEFKHKPVDTQESLYVFDRPEPLDGKTSLEDVKELFSRMGSNDRISLYKSFKLDKAAFSDEFRNWFEEVSSPVIVEVFSPYDLTTNQLHNIKAGLLAFKVPSGVVYYNIQVSSRNKIIVLTPF